jgi:hypothetical protein
LPNNFERNLKEEIWGCFKYVGIPLDTIMNMPIADRKFFISMHNRDSGNETTTSNEKNMEDMSEIDKMDMLNTVKDWH